MISQWWSLALTALGAFGLYLVFAHPTKWYGPAWSVALQLVWLSYGISSRQWGFVVSAFMYGGVNTYGLMKRRRDAAKKVVES